MGRHKMYRDSAALKAARLEAQRKRRGQNKPLVEAEIPDNVETEAFIEAEIVHEAEIAPKREAFMAFRHQDQVPIGLFEGHGRGVERTHTDGKQYVMVSRSGGEMENGVVTAEDWQERLGQECEHGLKGWSCHKC